MESTNKKILVVDDDPDIGSMLKMMLEFKGYNVIVAERAHHAESLIGNNPRQFGLIILDMLLSGENGTDVCARLKQDPGKASIPVVMISAHPNARQMCLDAGADDFISKPFDMADIVSKTQAYMSASSSRS